MDADNATSEHALPSAASRSSLSLSGSRPLRLREPAVLASGTAPREGLHEAQVLCWDDFLPASERAALYDHVVRRGRTDALVATTYGADGSRRVRADVRRAQSMQVDDTIRAIVEPPLAAARDFALARFQLDMFPMGRIEMEATASGDGDFFRKHSDDSHPDYFSRILSFVLYLHAQPRRFTGGALRVYDSLVESGRRTIAGSYVDIDPRDNRLVIFPCDRVHELMPVSLDSEDFADRRITINGACWCEGDAAEVMERWRAANPQP
jgi:hypothetical protein